MLPKSQRVCVPSTSALICELLLFLRLVSRNRCEEGQVGSLLCSPPPHPHFNTLFSVNGNVIFENRLKTGAWMGVECLWSNLLRLLHHPSNQEGMLEPPNVTGVRCAHHLSSRACCSVLLGYLFLACFSADAARAHLCVSTCSRQASENVMQACNTV